MASLLHWFLRETDFITMIKKSDVYFIFIHLVIKESILRGAILWFGSKFGKKLVRMNFTLLLEIFFCLCSKVS